MLLFIIEVLPLKKWVKVYFGLRGNWNQFWEKLHHGQTSSISRTLTKTCVVLSIQTNLQFSCFTLLCVLYNSTWKLRYWINLENFMALAIAYNSTTCRLQTFYCYFFNHYLKVVYFYLFKKYCKSSLFWFTSS